MKKLNVVIEAMLLIKINEIRAISEECYTDLKERLELFRYYNPAWLENKKYNRWNGNTDRYILTYDLTEKGIIKLPRGGREKLEEFLREYKIEPVFIDNTLVMERVSFSHNNTKLREEDQVPFVEAMLANNDGCFKGFTSVGKTPMLLHVAALLEQPTIVIVHTTFLQEQWIAEAMNPELLNISAHDIGGVGGVFAKKADFVKAFGSDVPYPSKEKRKYAKLNICLYQSLQNAEHMAFFKDRVGTILFDEGQKTPIEGVQKSVNNFRGRYRKTASANFNRKDTKQFLTFDAFGPIRYEAVEKDGASKILADINIIETGIEDSKYEDDKDYSSLIDRLSLNPERNMLICKRAIRKVKDKKLVLIFVERKYHAAILYRMLAKSFKVELLLGAVSKSDFYTLETRQKIEKAQAAFEKRCKKDFDMKSVDGKRAYRKALNDFIEEHVEINYNCSKKAMAMVLNYEHSGAFKRIEALGLKKEIDIIIASQKGEVGLSIRTIDHGIATMPQGNNEERFEQLKGRLERKYKKEDIDYFGHEKFVPTLDLISDNISVCHNARDKVKNAYGRRVKRLRFERDSITDKKTILRKKNKE